MKYRIRYSPAAQKDMEDVWDDVLEASASYDIADKYVEEFRRLKDEANFSVTSTQSIFDKKGINSAEPTMLNGEPVFRLTKSGMFGKVKVCYYISRIKDEITVDYLDKIFDELRRQANNENVFSAPDYKN